MPKTVGEHYREIALKYGVDLSAEDLNREFRRCWKIAPAHPKTIGPRPDDDKGWWRELVRQVIENTLPESWKQIFRHEDYFEELYAHFALPGVWAEYPETREVVRTLAARGLKLGVISNFDRRLYAVLEHLNLRHLFTSIVISSEVGADKPDPAIFQAALASVQVEPSEAVHVGDDPKCDWGARAVGIEVFELDRPTRTLADLVPWLALRDSAQNELANRRDVP